MDALNYQRESGADFGIESCESMQKQVSVYTKKNTEHLKKLLLRNMMHQIPKIKCNLEQSQTLKSTQLDDSSNLKLQCLKRKIKGSELNQNFLSKTPEIQEEGTKKWYSNVRREIIREYINSKQVRTPIKSISEFDYSQTGFHNLRSDLQKGFDSNYTLIEKIKGNIRKMSKLKRVKLDGRSTKKIYMMKRKLRGCMVSVQLDKSHNFDNSLKYSCNLQTPVQVKTKAGLWLSSPHKRSCSVSKISIH